MKSRGLAAARRSASFHGLAQGASDRATPIQLPENHRNLPRRPEINGGVAGQRLTKVLLNLTIEGSVGPVLLVMSLENTVADIVRAAVETYAKQGRRPLLPHTDPKAFNLHYSQYSLEILNPEEKLIALGSRNFFLYSKPSKPANMVVGRQNYGAKEVPAAAVKSR
ncbi:uncharacterized protein At4g22758-like [Phoenix dactylifera]|uniref:Uncharacterized protein At4g22758-like n=1 Tax=Phoenix dactylifera TaxID=42345 RepID=A0A8B7CQG6_PHODC|nr:uncharacterized protein At4g22758-like [Phoenix dactylifera]XP_038979153.1 uncharacterized protein At4g22758-like [Phoenix dactylifera]